MGLAEKVSVMVNKFTLLLISYYVVPWHMNEMIKTIHNVLHYFEGSGQCDGYPQHGTPVFSRMYYPYLPSMI